MKKKLMSLAILFAGALVLSAPAALAQGLNTGQDAYANSRPEGGSGTTFVDGLPYWFFQFTDLEGDYFETYFEGDASDFISRRPDGSIFFHYSEGRAYIGMRVSGLIYLSLSPLFGGDQGGMFQASFSATCPVFDPEGPYAWCAFGEGLISVNAQAQGVRMIDGAACTMNVHLTGKYVYDPERPWCQDGGITECIEFPNDRNQVDISVDCN